MTGGMAYLHDPEGAARVNMNLETLVTVPVTVAHWERELRALIEAHARETGSRKAAEILQHWDLELGNFIQVCPREMIDKLAHPIAEDQAAIPAE
jgi:glutamate synthase (NADPH/NADH) large chain